MTNKQYHSKLVELEQLLNDPDVPFAPGRVWALLAETAEIAGSATSLPSDADH